MSNKNLNEGKDSKEKIEEKSIASKKLSHESNSNITSKEGNEYEKKINTSHLVPLKKNDLTYLIILADDNHLINSCNERIIDGIMAELDLFKYEILKVSDGLDVIKIFLNNEIKDRIKLIITDENMDFFNGSEMIRFIRKVENLSKLNPIKIASVSSEDEKRHKDYLFDCGADFVFSKPLSKSNVRSALELDNNISER